MTDYRNPGLSYENLAFNLQKELEAGLITQAIYDGKLQALNYIFANEKAETYPLPENERLTPAEYFHKDYQLSPEKYDILADEQGEHH